MILKQHISYTGHILSTYYYPLFPLNLIFAAVFVTTANNLLNLLTFRNTSVNSASITHAREFHLGICKGDQNDLNKPT